MTLPTQHRRRIRGVVLELKVDPVQSGQRSVGGDEVHCGIETVRDMQIAS